MYEKMTYRRHTLDVRTCALAPFGFHSARSSAPFPSERDNIILSGTYLRERYLPLSPSLHPSLSPSSSSSSRHSFISLHFSSSAAFTARRLPFPGRRAHFLKPVVDVVVVVVIRELRYFVYSTIFALQAAEMFIRQRQGTGREGK
jgi:hypothetical protein